MSIRVEDVFFEDNKDEKLFEKKVEEKLQELQDFHGENFHRPVMEPLVRDMLKVEEEVNEYDRQIAAIRKQHGVLEVPPKLLTFLKAQSARLALLRNQLGINVKEKRVSSKGKLTGDAESDNQFVTISHRRGKPRDYEP